MTARVVAAPHLFPGKALWGETVGPMVDLGNHSSFDATVYLTPTQLWEAVRVGYELLTDEMRVQLAGLIGASPAGERETLEGQLDEALAECAELTLRLQDAQTNRLQVVKYDDVIAHLAPKKPAGKASAAA